MYTFFIYVLFARSDTGTKLKFDEVLLRPEGMHVTLRNLKGKKHTLDIKPLLFPPGAVQGLESLVAAWLALKKRLKLTSDENLWKFPWESTRHWPSSLGDDWRCSERWSWWVTQTHRLVAPGLRIRAERAQLPQLLQLGLSTPTTVTLATGRSSLPPDWTTLTPQPFPLQQCSNFLAGCSLHVVIYRTSNLL